MTDYGHDLLFGTFVTPRVRDAQQVVDLAVTADRAGLDLVSFQDHPYQPALLDAWTLLSFVAARTEKIRLSPNVLNLPLRSPTVAARAAASLDILSGGRVEFGIGAGAFWDGIAAMGGRRLSPGESVRALSEAIAIIRDVWDTETVGGLRHDGEFYQAMGAKRGPRPAHDIGIWVGAYGPKMLGLTGAVADGWLPSMEYLPQGLNSLPEMNARIDAAASEAGRPPTAVRRILNLIDVQFSSTSGGLLNGPVQQWVEELGDLALRHGISGFLIGGDDHAITERFAEEVAPAVRELVANERG